MQVNKSVELFALLKLRHNSDTLTIEVSFNLL